MERRRALHDLLKSRWYGMTKAAIMEVIEYTGKPEAADRKFYRDIKKLGIVVKRRPKDDKEWGVEGVFFHPDHAHRSSDE